MKVLILGATGFIGHNLTKALLAEGHQIIAITRSASKGKSILGDEVRLVEANPLRPGSWQDEVGLAEAVVILIGEPILDKKWTPERKQILLNSRIIPTRLVVEAIVQSASKPEALICGSAIGYYGNRGDEELTEESAPGHDFAAKLCLDWETEANKAATFGMRVVNLRTGFVLGQNGALKKMLTPFKFFVGGPIGSGQQYLSWIHISDHVSLTKFALTNKNIRGPLNMTAPNPVTNKEFSRLLGKTLKRPSWLPVPGFALKLMFGEGAEMLLGGQKVLPKKALEAGYQFKFAELESALTDILVK